MDVIHLAEQRDRFPAQELLFELADGLLRSRQPVQPSLRGVKEREEREDLANVPTAS